MEKTQNPKNSHPKEIFTFVVRRSMFFPVLYIFSSQIIIILIIFMIKGILDFIVRDFQIPLSVDDFRTWSTIILQFINIFVILYIVMDWLYTYYIIRPHEVIYRKGVLLEQRIDYKVDKINKIDIKPFFIQSFSCRLRLLKTMN